MCHAVHSRIDDLCQYCGGGINTCGCCRHRNTDEGENLRIEADVNLLRYVEGPSTINKSPRLLAAEIEVCGLKKKAGGTEVKKMVKGWHGAIVGDGSLPSGGFEINTHPASYDFWVHQVNDICSALKEAKAWVDQRAGCHTHVDCRDLDYLKLAGVLRLIACAEAGFYALINRDRATGENFCQFWSLNYLQKLRAAEGTFRHDMDERKVTLLYRKYILHALYGYSDKKRIHDASRGKGNGPRYRGVNLHSFLHRGTIEFRMPNGTIYPENIINWGMLLANTIDVGAGRSMEEIKEICKPVEQKVFEVPGLPARWTDCSKAILTASIDLVKGLAPTDVVLDWIKERIKRANGLHSATEAY